MRTKKPTKREIAKQRTYALTYVGRKFVLWNYEPRDLAYRDQLGFWHRANVIHLEIPVVVVAVEFDADDVASGRLVAEASGGERFYCTNTKNGYKHGASWDCPTRDDRKTERFPREFHEVTALYGRLVGGVPFVSPDGRRIVPRDVYICTKHERSFMPDDPDGCYDCLWESMETPKKKNASDKAS